MVSVVASGFESVSTPSTSGVVKLEPPGMFETGPGSCRAAGCRTRSGRWRRWWPAHRDPVGVGDRGPVGALEIDRDPAQRGLAGVLHAVVVHVDPRVVAHGEHGAEEPDVEGVVVGAGGAGGVGERREVADPDGLSRVGQRGVRVDRPVAADTGPRQRQVHERAGVVGRVVEGDRVQARRQERRPRDQVLVRETAEVVLAVGVGDGRADQRGALAEADGDAGDPRPAGVLDPVAVGIVPDPVADLDRRGVAQQLEVAEPVGLAEPVGGDRGGVDLAARSISPVALSKWRTPAEKMRLVGTVDVDVTAGAPGNWASPPTATSRWKLPGIVRGVPRKLSV